MTKKIFATEKEYVDATIQYIASICEKTGTIKIAVSGGRPPRPIFHAFFSSGLPTDRIHFFQVDDRYVPPTDPESNYFLLQEYLFSGQTPRNLTHFDTTLPIDEALSTYEEQIKSELPFDLCILGIGTDGHTASLFPYSPALQETTRLAAHTTTDQFSIHDRLTLTFPAIMQSKKLLLLVKGREIESTLEDILHSSKSIDELPAKKLLKHPNLMIHYCTR